MTPPEQQQLFAQVQQNLRKCKQLTQQNAGLVNELHQLLRDRVRPVRPPLSRNIQDWLPIIHFPPGEFTIGELERANPTTLTTEVRVELGDAISRGFIDVVRRNGKRDIPLPFRYHRTAEQISKLGNDRAPIVHPPKPSD